MTDSEFMFLAIGLFVGVGGGVALIEVIRSRPPAGRDVPTVVAQDADPAGFAATTAVAAFVAADPQPVGVAGDPEPVTVAVPDAVIAGDPADAAGAAPPARSAHPDTCADERRLADDRCELATRAREQAAAAADAFQRVQRTYDAHVAASTAAADSTDPETVRHLKEEAQRAFRAGSRASTSSLDAEAAARSWLQEINRINREAAAATLAARRGREAATAVRATLERLSHEADAARVAAEMADAACLAARTAVAECDERAVAGPETSRPTPRPLNDSIPSVMDREAALGVAFRGNSRPRVFRLLHGDADAMAVLVASLAGDDPTERLRWRQAFTGLLEAVLADAIEQSFLCFPVDHPFWGTYSRPQQREIARALASLGFHFDGLGGWADERLPSQRDLSLALGYSGLDPVRVRQWPSQQQTVELFRDVEVAADEYLASAAGDLSLAEMVVMLGRRADTLVDLWNHWGRIRPLLLEEA